MKHYRIFDVNKKPIAGEFASHKAASEWAASHVRGFWCVFETDIYGQIKESVCLDCGKEQVQK